MKTVEDVYWVMVFIIVDVVVLIYGTLERGNKEYNNIITMLKIEVKPRFFWS